MMGADIVKRLLSLLMALILLLCLIPFGSIAVSAAATDLEITDFSWNTATEIAPGTVVTFAVTVKNGGGAVTDPFTVTFGTATQTFSTVTYSDGIAEGGTVTIKSQPWTALKGDYMVAACINTTNTVAESNKYNNAKQANLRVANDKLTSAFSTTQEMMEDGGLTTLIFSDDFNDLSAVDTKDTGAPGYRWYVDRPYGAVTLTTADYSVKDGVMTVHNEIPTYNYGLGTYHPGSRTGWSYNLGYMEIRLRIPRPRANEDGEKGVPAIWALPPEKLTNSTNKWVELDWMEYWGIEPGKRPGGYYTVCLHEQDTRVDTWYTNGNTAEEGLGDGDWHVMGWLWQKGVFITYYDGIEVARVTYAADQLPTPSITAHKGLPEDGIFTLMDTQYQPIIIGGSKDNPMELDYVRVWSGNDDYTPRPITTRPMTAKEFVKMHLVDADGNPIKAATEENYGYLVTSERDWKKLDVVTQNEVNAILKANGQPTYEKLLAQAKIIYEGPTTTTKKPTTTTTKPTSKPTGGGIVTLPPKPTTDTVGTTAIGETTAADTETTVGGTEATTAAGTSSVTTATGGTKTTAASTTPQEEPASPTLFIIIGVVAALLIAAAVLVLVLKKKKPTETE